ncbi:MAG: hypothetical protein HKO68_08335 [Desulfobacterales bacterium]|nr:hypothetical protein [Desulfobacterales bacterium]
MIKRISMIGGAADGFIFGCLFVALMLLLVSGCGASNYGRLQSSREATEVFNQDQVISDYTYYYSGFQTIPYGIIGIDNNYRLRSSHWKRIDMNPTLLNQLTYRMQNVYSLDPRGSWILDPDGRRVGIWYSSQLWTKVKLSKNNQIVVITPKPPELSGNR